MKNFEQEIEDVLFDQIERLNDGHHELYFELDNGYSGVVVGYKENTLIYEREATHLDPPEQTWRWEFRSSKVELFDDSDEPVNELIEILMDGEI